MNATVYSGKQTVQLIWQSRETPSTCTWVTPMDHCFQLVREVPMSPVMSTVQCKQISIRTSSNDSICYYS